MKDKNAFRPLLVILVLLVPDGCSKTGNNDRDGKAAVLDVAPGFDAIVGDVPHAIDSLDLNVYADAGIPKTSWVITGDGTDDIVPTAVAVDANGAVFVTGHFGQAMTIGSVTLSAIGDADIFIAKLDPSGKVEWAVSAGGAMGDYPTAVATDAKGDCYVTGTYEQAADIGPFALASNGDTDVFVAKLDSTAKVSWAKSYGGAVHDYAGGIGVDSSGNVYVAGGFGGTVKFDAVTLNATSVTNGFVAKMDGIGKVGWAVQLPSSEFSLVQDIAVDQAGNSDVAGRFQDSMTFANKTLLGNGLFEQAFVGRLDPNGKVLWAASTGSDKSNTAGFHVAPDGAGGSYVAGWFAQTVNFGSTTLTTQGGQDIFVAKLDSNGVFLWAVGAGSNAQDSAAGVAVDGFGDPYAAGTIGGTATIGGINVGSGGQDGLVAKLDASGKVQWAETTTGPGPVPMGGVAADRAGNCYAVGGFKGTAVVGGLNLIAKSTKAFFVWKIGVGL